MPERAASATSAAAATSAIPTANEAAGIAAATDGASGSDCVSSRGPRMSDAPTNASSPAATRPAASIPSRASTRAAARAIAGISGNMYCGSFDWFKEKRASGPSTQQVRNHASRACSFTRRASQPHRQLGSPARAGTIQGKAARGTMGK